METKRILYLDYARVFTALLVILGHLYTPSDDNVVRILIYQFHMPLFFIISGILHRRTGDVQFKKYARKILIPIVSFSTIFALITFPLYRWAGWFGYKESVPESLFSGFSTIQSVFNYLRYYASAILHGTNMLDGPCWFLIALLWCKLFADFFDKSLFSKVIVISIWLFAIIVLLKFNKKLLFLGQAAVAVPYYMTGYFIKKALGNILSSKYKCLFFFASIFIFIISVYINGRVSMFTPYFGRNHFPINMFFFYVAGFSGSFVILYLSSLITKETFISRTSKALISILGFQAIFVFVVDNTVGYNLSYAISLILAILIYFGCVGFHRLFEEYAPSIIGANSLQCES